MPGAAGADPASAGADPVTVGAWVGICRASRALCREYGLVLEAVSLPYRIVEDGPLSELWTPESQARLVREELARYAAERAHEAPPAAPHRPFRRAGIGAIAYGAVLIAVAYCAGADLFGVDWLAAGAIDAERGLRGEWWRAITALTLHFGPEHLFGNLLFGIGAGVLASRLLGAGVAWLSILGAGSIANLLELAIAPTAYRAAGASTAVFAALGLLTGYAWRLQVGTRARWLYRAGPLAAGVGLLLLLGAGKVQVDLLGHLLGFLTGLALGVVYARAGLPRSRRPALQAAAGAIALGLVALAWTLALRAALTR